MGNREDIRKLMRKCLALGHSHAAENECIDEILALLPEQKEEGEIVGWVSVFNTGIATFTGAVYSTEEIAKNGISKDGEYPKHYLGTVPIRIPAEKSESPTVSPEDLAKGKAAIADLVEKHRKSGRSKPVEEACRDFEEKSKYPPEGRGWAVPDAKESESISEAVKWLDGFGIGYTRRILAEISRLKDENERLEFRARDLIVDNNELRKTVARLKDEGGFQPCSSYPECLDKFREKIAVLESDKHELKDELKRVKGELIIECGPTVGEKLGLTYEQAWHRRGECITELEEEISRLQSELAHIDAILSRRDALDGFPTRIDKIVHALHTAGLADRYEVETERVERNELVDKLDLLLADRTMERDNAEVAYRTAKEELSELHALKPWSDPRIELIEQRLEALELRGAP